MVGKYSFNRVIKYLLFVSAMQCCAVIPSLCWIHRSSCLWLHWEGRLGRRQAWKVNYYWHTLNKVERKRSTAIHCAGMTEIKKLYLKFYFLSLIYFKISIQNNQFHFRGLHFNLMSSRLLVLGGVLEIFYLLQYIYF